MSKQIKVTDAVYAKLVDAKQDGDTMSDTIDTLFKERVIQSSNQLDRIEESLQDIKAALEPVHEASYITKEGIANVTIPENVTVHHTPASDNPFAEKNTSVADATVDEKEGEWPCCDKSTPCRHWEYNADTLEWRNYLSGRKKMAV